MDIQSRKSHKTQKTQRHVGICFPHWVNGMTWGESPAGNLSRGFKLQVKVPAWKNKPKHEKPPLLSATGLEISWFCPDIIVTSDINLFGFFYFLWSSMYKAYMRDSASILKNTGKPCFIRLFLPLSSPPSMWPYELQSSKPTAVTPEHLMGRYWIFLLFPFWIQTRKWKNKENTKIREPCCGYTLETPIALSGMCVSAHLKP